MHIRHFFHVFAIGSALLGGPSHAQKPFHDGYGGGVIPGLKPLKNSMNLLVVGDWGRAGEYRQREVAVQLGNAAHTVEADFIVSTGDNFYPSGVASVEDPLWKRSFEDVYTAFSLQEEWYPVLGNHDYGGNAQAQLDYSRVSRRWRMPSRYHSFERTTDDGTSILFVFLDTNPFEKKYHREPQDSFFQANLTVGSSDSLAQKQWLLEVLQKSKARWKIVFGHHPLYSAGKRKGLTEDVASSLLPILLEGGAHLYVAGHEHHLEHDVLEGGLHHFISGAGSEVRPVSGNTLTRYAASEHGFLSLSINRDAVQCRFVNDSGRIVYVTGIRAAR
jgi:tartrate-resistant acid phosphatase type 5